MATDQFITCSDCNHQYVLDIEKRPVKGSRLDVGHECPMCHTWYHSFFTTPKLQKQAELVNRAKSRANKSDTHFQRYKRKLAEYQRSFALVNS